MKKLGYIVTDKKINNVKDFVGVVNDISLTDPTKPVLLVGLENAKKNIENFSILKKKVNDNLFWTFRKTEKRVDFENDINYFYNYIINNITKNIKYYYINILKLKYNKIKKLYNIIYSTDLKNIYISNGMVYVPYESNILGFSLRILDYCRINEDKVLSRIKSNPSNRIIDDRDKYVFKLSRDLGNKKYAIPYFISS